MAKDRKRGIHGKDYWRDKIKDRLEEVEQWAKDGYPNSQLASELGVSETCFYDMMNKHPSLEQRVVRGRRWAELRVEDAMFKKAVGSRYKEVTRERKMNPETGDYEMLTTKIVYKDRDGDFQAQKYWLEHRAPKRWQRDIQEPINIDTMVATIKGLADLVNNPQPEREIGCEENGLEETKDTKAAIGFATPISSAQVDEWDDDDYIE